MVERPEASPRRPDSSESLDALLLAAANDVGIRGEPVAPEPVFAALRRACRHLMDGDGAPWRFVHAASARAHEAVTWNFEVCNADVLARRGDHPRWHDLAALRDAPVQIAAFADTAHPVGGAPDGRTAGDLAVARTAAAIARFRLCAAAGELAVRWITALDPAGLTHALDVSGQWRFVGYLCVGRQTGAMGEPAGADPPADPLAGRSLRR